MAFVPFTKDDQPTMAAFNEKFQQIFNLADSKTEMEILTYVGTGTYGPDNPNSLSFKSRPSFVVIFASQYMGGVYAADRFPIMINGEKNIVAFDMFTEEYSEQSALFQGHDSSADSFGGKISADGKTLYWYFEYFSSSEKSSSPGAQFNREGTKYWVLVLY